MVKVRVKSRLRTVNRLRCNMIFSTMCMVRCEAANHGTGMVVLLNWGYGVFM